MADNEDKNPKGEPEEQPKEQAAKSGAKIGILAWIIMAVLITVMAGSGFVLGRLFAGSSSPATTDPSQENPPTQEITPSGPDAGSKDTWLYKEMKSVVANPNEPGAKRFVRAGLNLEVSPKLSEEDFATLMGAKEPFLTNWLNLYLKSLRLEDMENDSDLRRIESQACDAFNEILFPDAEPQIKRVLIKEFNIQ
ncbi:MAG: flagellar basal body-associated FliL family protein [Planctomycetes bacterium]|nr:flagellar basal body-associated FliL family protein [Planctomycetota bacterium]